MDSLAEGDQDDGRCSASRAKSATASVSPRADGSMPAARSACSAAAADPAQPASAARSVLRRWANAASTTAKTSLPVRRGRRRVAAHEPHQPGVDVGHRPEHRRRHRPARVAVGVPGRLDARHAVDPRPGRRDEPVGDLGLHHHQCRGAGTAAPPAGAARPARRRCTAGSPPARSARRRARRPPAARPRSPRPATARRAIAPRTVAGSAPASTGSISTAVTGCPASSSPSVNEPSPGPTSSTRSPASSSAVRTMRRIVFGSCRKFCPSVLVGRMPSSAGQRADLGRAEQRRMSRRSVTRGGRRRAGRTARRPTPARPRRTRASGEWLNGAVSGSAPGRRGAEERHRAGHLVQHAAEVLRAGVRVRQQDRGRLAEQRRHRVGHERRLTRVVARDRVERLPLDVGAQPVGLGDAATQLDGPLADRLLMLGRERADGGVEGGPLGDDVVLRCRRASCRR